MGTHSKLSMVMLLPAMALACNDAPVKNLEKTFTFKVTKDTSGAAPIKIDFLWVVDNSTSMCQEQVGLTTNFKTFVDQIKTSFDIDPRLAVTTVDAQCEVNGTSVFSARGKFNTHSTKSFGRPCQFTANVECRADSDCDGLDCELFGKCGGDQGAWACREATSEACVTNPNGSPNTSCRRRCATDEDCASVFGDAAYRCQKPSASPEDWGCLRDPDSINCPDELPEFLDGNNIDLFPCIATVGVNTESCLDYEQPMRSGLMALDPVGPQADQAKRFLRDDAYLVIIFVTDEEDCSVADTARLNEQFYDTCGLLKTTDEGGPLVPVAHYVNQFKGLKTDPGRVIVAAIAGDSTATDPATVALERSEYIASKLDAKTCYNQTTICQNTTSGLADYGARFIELTAGFGPNGTFTNICKEQGIEVALQQIAKTIVTVVNKVCLPRPVLEGLTVKRTRNGVTTVLTEGDGDNRYRVIQTAEECTTGGKLLPALAFSDVPIPGESIEISYQGDPQFE